MAKIKQWLVHAPMVLVSLPGLTACKLKGSTSSMKKIYSKGRLNKILVFTFLWLCWLCKTSACIDINFSSCIAFGPCGCCSCAGHTCKQNPNPLTCSPVLNVSVMIAFSLVWVCVSWEVTLPPPWGCLCHSCGIAVMMAAVCLIGLVQPLATPIWYLKLEGSSPTFAGNAVSLLLD